MARKAKLWRRLAVGTIKARVIRGAESFGHLLLGSDTMGHVPSPQTAPPLVPIWHWVAARPNVVGGCLLRGIHSRWLPGKQAIVSIRNAGAKIDFDPSEANWLAKCRGAILGADATAKVRRVYLRKLDVGDEVFMHLRRFPELEHLGLEHTHVTDDGLKNLVFLPKLCYLILLEPRSLMKVCRTYPSVSIYFTLI